MSESPPSILKGQARVQVLECSKPGIYKRSPQDRILRRIGFTRRDSVGKKFLDTYCEVVAVLGDGSELRLSVDVATGELDVTSVDGTISIRPFVSNRVGIRVVGRF
jgi:hypothetical protein